MSYQKKKLGNYIEILSGFAFKTKNFSESGIPVIKIKNITPPAVTLKDLSYVSEEIAKQKQCFILGYNDVVIALTGSHINQMASVVGRIARVKYQEKTLLNQRVGKITVKDSNICNLDYIYYYLSQDKIKIELATKAGGTANQANISPTDIKNLEIPFPNIDTQSRISNILSAYDNLIENNQKQIKLLEEAAQRLYKEWFVDLHFPGYENTPIVDGVPEGWKRETVAECLLSHTNGGWGKETSIGKYIHLGKVIRGTDISDIKAGHCDNVPVRYHTDSDIQKKKLCVDDIVFELSNGNINNIGRNLFIDKLILKNIGEDTICASFCKLLRPKDRMHALILYFEIQDMQSSGRMLPYKKHGANGINNFDFDGFLKHSLLIPNDAALLKQFKTIMFKISNIQGQIPILIEARDRLLPKLMSGELEV